MIRNSEPRECFSTPCARTFIGLSALIIVAGFAPNAAAGKLSVPSGLAAPPGAEILVPITLEGAVGVQGVSFEVSYPSLLLTYIDAEKGALVSNWTFAKNGLSSSVVVAAFGLTPVSATGSVALLRFQVKPGVSLGTVASLQFSQAALNDGAIAVTPVNGAITVANAAQLSMPSISPVMPGAQTTLSIVVNQSANSIQGLATEITVDPSLFDIVGISRGTLINHWGNFENPPGQSPYTRAAGFGNTPSQSSGELLKLTLQAKSAAPLGAAGYITIERVSLNDGAILVRGTRELLSIGNSLPTAYVQIGYGGTPLGTTSNPAANLSQAVNLVANNGDIRFLNSGNLNETIRITKAVRIHADAGPVRLGASGSKDSLGAVSQSAPGLSPTGAESSNGTSAPSSLRDRVAAVYHWFRGERTEDTSVTPPSVHTAGGPSPVTAPATPPVLDGRVETPPDEVAVDSSRGDAIDVQRVIQAALIAPFDGRYDINEDGVVNATDVQLAIQRALGLH